MSRLFAWKFRLFWRSLARRSQVAAAVSLILAFFGLVWSVAVFVGSRYVFAWTARGLPPGVPPEAAAMFAGMERLLLSGVYLVGLSICLFTAFGTAFVTMYSSSDLPLLFCAPLTVTQVFMVKFAEILATESLWVILLVLPVTLGYGAGVGAGWWYYPAAVVLAFVTVFLPAAVGTSLNLLAMRLIPPYRVKELGAALGSLLGAAFYALSQLGPRYAAGMNPQELAHMVGRFRLASAGYSPAWWLAEAARTAARGPADAFLGWFGLVAACSLVFFALSFVLVQEAFYGGWAGSGEVRGRQRRRRFARQPRTARAPAAVPEAAGRAVGTCVRRAVGPVPAAGAARAPGGLPLPVLALAAKEVRSIARDMREWAQALYLVVVMGVAVVVPVIKGGSTSFLAGSGGRYAGLGAAYLMLAGLAGYLGVGAVGREGKSWPLLRSTPVAGEEILWGKVLGVTPLVIAPGLVLAPLLALVLGGGTLAVLLIAAFVLIVAPGLVSLNVAAGALYPNFTARDPRQRTSGWAFLLSLLLEAGYAGVLAAGVWMMGVGSWTGVRAWLRAVGLVIVLVGSACATAVPPALAGRLLDVREAIAASPGRGPGPGEGASPRGAAGAQEGAEDTGVPGGVLAAGAH
ncbi:MAG: hypothetical protein AB1446_10920 [Bacillota bacterium]